VDAIGAPVSIPKASKHEPDHHGGLIARCGSHRDEAVIPLGPEPPPSGPEAAVAQLRRRFFFARGRVKSAVLASATFLSPTEVLFR
jgi:hypothetical protein